MKSDIYGAMRTPAIMYYKLELYSYPEYSARESRERACIYSGYDSVVGSGALYNSKLKK